jgi:hypothetical protein
MNISQELMTHFGNKVGCKIIGVLSYEIFKKSLQLENITSSRSFVTNLLTNDIYRIYEAST